MGCTVIRIVCFEILRILRNRKIYLFIVGLYVCIALSLPSLDSNYSIINFNGVTGLRNSTWISTLCILLTSFYLIVFGYYFFRNYFNKDVKSDRFQNYKSSTTFFRILLIKSLSLISFFCVLIASLIIVILILNGINGTLTTFNLFYLLMLMFRYTCPVILFICIISLLFDLVPILFTKAGGFIYLFVFIAVILNESNGNNIQFSPLNSMLVQMKNFSGSSSVGYSIITNRSAVKFVELLPIKLNFIELVLFNLILVGVLCGLILILTKFWEYSSKEKRQGEKNSIDINAKRTTPAKISNSLNEVKMVLFFSHEVNISSYMNQILHIARVELHLLFSKCKTSIIILCFIYILWLIKIDLSTKLAPLIFPIFMLPAIMFLLEYPRLYDIHDFLCSFNNKHLNTVTRITFIFLLLTLFIPIVIKFNLVNHNFNNSFLLALTGSLLVLSVATFSMDSNNNYFEGLFVCVWYLGILNKVPFFDIYFGLKSNGLFGQVFFNVSLLIMIATINFLHHFKYKKCRRNYHS